MSDVIKKLQKRLKNCQKLLRKQMNDPSLEFHHKPRKASYGKELFQIHSSSSRSAQAKYPYDVTLLSPSPTANFWVAVTVEFARQHNGDWELYQVSIIIFEGSATDSEKMPILRAEWDALDSESKHAQPHWHVYTHGPQSSVNSRFDEIEDVKSFGETQDTDVKGILEQTPKIHFAMASQWHDKASGSSSVDLTDECITYWIPSCVQYIKEQLAYAHLI